MPVLALRRDSDSETRWMAVTSRATILDTPAEDLVFLESPGDRQLLRRELDRRWPPTDPRLTRVILPTAQGLTTENQTVNVLAYSFYDSTGLSSEAARDEACAAAKCLGKVRLRYSLRCQPAELYERGCYVRFKNDRRRPEGWKAGDDENDWDDECYNELVYNPKLAAKHMSRPRIGGKRPYSMPTYELHRATHDCYSKLRAAFPQLSWSIRYRRNCLDDARLLMEAATIFDLLYGKNAHRQLGSFQHLVDEWRRHPAQTRKTYIARHKDLASFCDWMERESRARRPAVATKFVQRLRLWAYTPMGVRPKKAPALTFE